MRRTRAQGKIEKEIQEALQKPEKSRVSGKIEKRLFNDKNNKNDSSLKEHNKTQLKTVEPVAKNNPCSVKVRPKVQTNKDVPASKTRSQAKGKENKQQPKVSQPSKKATEVVKLNPEISKRTRGQKKSSEDDTVVKRSTRSGRSVFPNKPYTQPRIQPKIKEKAEKTKKKSAKDKATADEAEPVQCKNLTVELTRLSETTILKLTKADAAEVEVEASKQSKAAKRVKTIDCYVQLEKLELPTKFTRKAIAKGAAPPNIQDLKAKRKTEKVQRDARETPSPPGKRNRQLKLNRDEAKPVVKLTQSKRGVDKQLPVETKTASKHPKATTKPPPLKSLKLIDESDDDDPYNFEFSQTENANNRAKKQASKKRVFKTKAGGNMELLIEQKKLDAVENSCNVANNPKPFVEQRQNLEKQISVPTTINKFAIDSEVKLIPATSLPTAATLGPHHSKVWHSPVLSNTSKSPCDEIIYTRVSDSPPIQSLYALKMIQARRRNIYPQNSSPLRVPGNLPSTSYMGLSENDGTPTLSSDMVKDSDRPMKINLSVMEPICETLPDTDSINKSLVGDSLNKSLLADSLNKSLLGDSLNKSLLGDSNAENVKPAGFNQSPVKNTKKTIFADRSPLKDLPQPAGDVSSLSAFNVTIERTIIAKNETIAFRDERNESIDILEMCEEVERNNERTAAEPSREEREQSESRDAFGFDELMEKYRGTVETSAGIADTATDYREKVEKFKQYLPSLNNMNRDKDVFPTSPLKQTEAFKEAHNSKVTSVSKFFLSSTPLGKRREGSKIPFEDMSAIEQKEETVTVSANSSVELFEDQTEVYKPRNSYSRGKRATEFLRRTDASEDESEADEEPKVPLKPKRMKPNVEETGAFKKFVQDKSKEFAEVDDYEMVVE